MPEYLAPGVYVEETSFRAKSIEGVSTSIAALIGPTRYGPTSGQPELLTAFTEFERMYGGIDRMEFRTTTSLTAPTSTETFQEVQNYVAFAARAFFDNGGTKLYVSRVYATPAGATAAYGRASAGAPDSTNPVVNLRARFPGQAGNMHVRFEAHASGNALGTTIDNTGATVNVLRGLAVGDVVFIARAPAAAPANTTATVTTADTTYGFYDVGRDANGNFQFEGASTIALSALSAANDMVIPVTVYVSTQTAGRFDDEQRWGEFSFTPSLRDSLTAYFHPNPESHRRRITLPLVMVWPNQDETDPHSTANAPHGYEIVAALLPDLRNALQLDHELSVRQASTTPPTAATARTMRLTVGTGTTKIIDLAGGHDGMAPEAIDYEGREVGAVKTGFLALEDVEEISIVAAPACAALYGDSSTAGQAEQIEQLLIQHCEKMRYRIAVLDSGPDYTLADVRAQRGAIDSTRAAIYYPWIRIIDPLAPRGTPAENQELLLPPSGFVAGIYARNDVERGVHKSPANEVVRGAIGFEFVLNKGQQDVLNPDGVNAFRFFEGRGYRLWGARTASSDPEWKYVGVRRYFQYLEHSIERGTQWAVFENNNDRLWANVKRTIEDFLFNEWNNGALFGAKPEEAYWVRCDRTTMTQNDIDNGRLVCLIGVSPNKPAEFVIFRIGQWTADRKQ